MKLLAIIGGVAAAVIVAVVILASSLSSSNSEPPITGATTTSAVAPPTASTSQVVTPPPSDSDTLIRTLAAAGIDTTLPGGNTELATHLANTAFTPYPAVASALLDAIGTKQLRQPVAIDAIVFDYQVFAGAPPPNRADLVDVDVLKKSVAYEYTSRYGGDVVTFKSLLVPR
jgi:hypothetical protein